MPSRARTAEHRRNPGSAGQGRLTRQGGHRAPVRPRPVARGRRGGLHRAAATTVRPWRISPGCRHLEVLHLPPRREQGEPAAPCPRPRPRGTVLHHRGEGATTSKAIDRLGYVIGRLVEVLCAELPYVTLLLRVRGNTDTERWALESSARNSIGSSVSSSMEAADRRGRSCRLGPGLVPSDSSSGWSTRSPSGTGPGRIEVAELKVDGRRDGTHRTRRERP